MKYPMTVQGAEQLRQELQELKSSRVAISRAIGEARKLGDLRENADYHAAKEKQGLTEARIRYIETRLSLAQVIDVSRLENRNVVIFGATVHLEELDSGKTVKYRIVGEDQADLSSGSISNISPFAQAMLGKQLGEIFTVGEGDRTRDWEIKKIELLA